MNTNKNTPSIPGANVDADGRCNTPTHAETERLDTGDACVDGLNWPHAGKDVSVSAKDGGFEDKSE